MGNVIVGLVGLGLLALYIWSIVWACRDAEGRGKSGCLVGLLVMLLSWPIGLVVWLIFRPEEKSPKRDEEDWGVRYDVVYTTKDPWEAEVIRSALLSEDIRAKVRPTKGDRKSRQSLVSVPTSKVTEAQMVIRRTSIVISKKADILAEQKEQEKLASQVAVEKHQVKEPVIPEEKPIGVPVLLAEKDDVGKIFYNEEEDEYELRLGMEFYKESHFMSAEEWEEFIDFSAQRQEFFILLKEKYPRLAALLKEHKMRPSFLKLIEYSYGKSQPPKK